VLIDTPAHGWEFKIKRTPRPTYAERMRVATTTERFFMRADRLQSRAKGAYYRATAGVVPRPLTRQLEPFTAHHERVIRLYEPTAAYRGAVLVLCGDEHDVGDPDLGWRRWVTGPITTARVPGEHEQVLREPWVDAVAGAMNDAIAALDGT
jgi:thioesterase domain-containing protein